MPDPFRDILAEFGDGAPARPVHESAPGGSPMATTPSFSPAQLRSLEAAGINVGKQLRRAAKSRQRAARERARLVALAESGPLGRVLAESTAPDAEKELAEASTADLWERFAGTSAAATVLALAGPERRRSLETILRARPDLLAEAAEMTTFARLAESAERRPRHSETELAEMSTDDLFAELGRVQGRAVG